MCWRHSGCELSPRLSPRSPSRGSGHAFLVCHLAIASSYRGDGPVVDCASAYSVYLSKTRQQFVPPKPKLLDITRVEPPSWRFVRMFMPSDSSTISLMLALSARKSLLSISNE